jgi:hypothetical protein
MARANAILSKSEVDELEARRRRAVATVAQQGAIRAVKRQLQMRGLKPQYISRREIVAAANEYLRDHPSIRAELIAEAREIVDQWQAEGFFGKRAALNAQNLKVSCVEQVRAAQGFQIHECQTQPEGRRP